MGLDRLVRGTGEPGALVLTACLGDLVLSGNLSFAGDLALWEELVLCGDLVLEELLGSSLGEGEGLVLTGTLSGAFLGDLARSGNLSFAGDLALREELVLCGDLVLGGLL